MHTQNAKTTYPTPTMTIRINDVTDINDINDIINITDITDITDIQDNIPHTYDANDEPGGVKVKVRLLPSREQG